MIVTLTAKEGDGIRVVCQYAIDFREGLKSRSFQWNSDHKAWHRFYSIVPGFPDYADRAAELERDLLWMREQGADLRSDDEKVIAALEALGREKE